MSELWLPAGYRAQTWTEVKRSRFGCTLARVDSEADARTVIAEVRQAHRDARHHCTAFVVADGDGPPLERSNDDGEPSGTAGTPMLEVLRGAGLTQVVAVVTRYFGGVLLGTGGLARAYADAVADALAVAPRVTRDVRTVFTVTLAPADAGRVQAELIGHGCALVTARWGVCVELDVAVADAAAFGSLLASLTKGAGRATASGQLVVEVPLPA